MGYTDEEILAMRKQEQQQQQQSQSNPDSPITGPAPSNTMVLDEPLQLQPKKPANRCSKAASGGEPSCNKKLLLTDITCKCCKRFCSAHRMPEDHDCSYDYKSAGKKILETNLLKVDGSKMERL